IVAVPNDERVPGGVGNSYEGAVAVRVNAGVAALLTRRQRRIALDPEAKENISVAIGREGRIDENRRIVSRLVGKVRRQGTEERHLVHRPGSGVDVIAVVDGATGPGEIDPTVGS